MAEVDGTKLILQVKWSEKGYSMGACSGAKARIPEKWITFWTTKTPKEKMHVRYMRQSMKGSNKASPFANFPKAGVSFQDQVVQLSTCTHAALFSYVKWIGSKGSLIVYSCWLYTRNVGKPFTWATLIKGTSPLKACVQCMKVKASVVFLFFCLKFQLRILFGNAPLILHLI